MHHLQAKAVVAAMAAITGGQVMEPEKVGFKTFVKAENDLKTNIKKPVNGYQAKQRKRKLKRRGGK
jgi:hypothetical protein